MVVPLVMLAARTAMLNPSLQTAAMAAINVLRSRGLQAATLNQFREALIAAGHGSAVKFLGDIAAALF